MLVYHGSSRRFSKLRIAKSLVTSESTLLTEGMGIYFSTLRDVGASYGKYLYTLDINDNYIKDFRGANRCKQYIKEMLKYVYKITSVNLLRYIDSEIHNIAYGMYDGKLQISSLHSEIELTLDSVEEWNINISQSKREEVYRVLRRFSKQSLKAYLYNHYIRGVGVLKDTSPQVVQIVAREIII